VELHAVAPFTCREVDGVMVHGLKPYRRSLRCLNWLRLLTRAVRSEAAVFHFHDPELIPVGLALRLVKRGKKVVYDIHEHSDATILSREWVPRPLRRPAARLVDKIERATAGMFSGIVVADARMAEKFTGARRIVEIRNFPQASFGERYAEEQRRDKTMEEKKDPVVVYVGVMGQDRGLETVLEAMPMVRSRVPEASCFLVGRVSGSGLSSRYRDNLEEYLAGGNITVTGQVDYEKVMQYLAGSDVGWVPFPPIAKHRWGIGTKLTEYMAMALPVVASDYGEGAEVVRREKCGILVDPEDPSDHAEAIALLLTDREMARELGQKGREAFLRGYCWEAQGAKLLDFYNRVGGRNPEADV
jgi:glycosyltransferase involved in cell wall biosynthesis